MFTTWDQIRTWIEDNNFPRWIFYKNDPEERTDKANDKIIDSNNFTVSDMEDKLAMTEKYLRQYGGKVWGVGFKSTNYTGDGVQCTARLEAQQPTSGIGSPYDAQNIGELRESIKREIRAEIENENYKREKAEFEREKKEFEEEKKSAIGAVIHYFAPIGQMLMQKHINPMRNVAGVDANEDVHAARIVAPKTDAPETEEPEQESPFTDEEADELFALMAEFKKVEPDYLKLLRSVVEMAKNGDATYTMAKGLLIK